VLEGGSGEFPAVDVAGAEVAGGGAEKGFELGEDDGGGFAEAGGDADGLGTARHARESALVGVRGVAGDGLKKRRRRWRAWLEKPEG